MPGQGYVSISEVMKIQGSAPGDPVLSKILKH